MQRRRLLGMAVLVGLSFLAGRWSKSFTNVVVPGKVVRLVSLAPSPVNPDIMVFTVMSPDEKLIGLFDAPQDACEVRTELMPPRTFQLVRVHKRDQNPYGLRVVYNPGELPLFAPAPHINQPRSERPSILASIP